MYDFITWEFVFIQSDDHKSAEKKEENVKIELQIAAGKCMGLYLSMMSSIELKSRSLESLGHKITSAYHHNRNKWIYNLIQIELKLTESVANASATGQELNNVKPKKKKYLIESVSK